MDSDPDPAPDSSLFVNDLQCQPKKIFFAVFLLITFKNSYRGHKSKNRNHGFSNFFCLMSAKDPDPEGP